MRRLVAPRSSFDPVDCHSYEDRQDRFDRSFRRAAQRDGLLYSIFLDPVVAALQVAADAAMS